MKYESSLEFVEKEKDVTKLFRMKAQHEFLAYVLCALQRVLRNCFV